MTKENTEPNTGQAMGARTLRYLIAVPCMNDVPVQTMNSLIGMRQPPNTVLATSEGSLIYDSRNSFAARAIIGDRANDGDWNDGDPLSIDRVLFIDSDMVVPPDMMERMAADMDEGREFVTGLCFRRKMPTAPTIFKSLRYGTEGGDVQSTAEAYRDYPRNSVFEIAGCGMAAAMISTQLLKDVWDRFGPPFNPLNRLGEDLSFCARVTQLGRKMYCDSRIRVGHIGTWVFDENTWLMQERGVTMIPPADRNGQHQTGTAMT